MDHVITTVKCIYIVVTSLSTSPPRPLGGHVGSNGSCAMLLLSAAYVMLRSL